MCASDKKQPVESLAPGAEAEITLQLTAPEMTGRHVAYFRMQTSEGSYFGQRLWADLRVTEGKEDYSQLHDLLLLFFNNLT